MKLPYALLGLTIFVFITVMATIHVTPSAGYFKSEVLSNPTCPNSAPTAAADSYTVHGSFETPVESPVTGVLKNDSDPENEALHCNFQNVQTPIGLATIYNNGKAALIQITVKPATLPLTTRHAIRVILAARPA